MQFMIVFSVWEGGALATRRKIIRSHYSNADCAAKCSLILNIAMDSGTIVWSEELHAMLVYAMNKHFRARCARKYFFNQNMTKNSGTTVTSETLPANIVFARDAPIPNAKLVKHATTQNSKPSGAQRFSQANCNCHAMPTSWLPGNARDAFTHAAKCVGEGE